MVMMFVVFVTTVTLTVTVVDFVEGCCGDGGLGSGRERADLSLFFERFNGWRGSRVMLSVWVGGWKPIFSFG